MMLVRTPAVKNMYDELPDDAIDIIKEGVRRYADRKTTEEGRVNEAIAEYARRSVEEGKLSKRDAARILKKYGIEYESEQQPRLSVEDEEDEGTRFSLGAPYQGSKNRVAKRIIDVLPKGERFVDLFSGGGAMTHAAILSGKYGGYRMNDKNPVGQELFMQGVRGEWDNYDRKNMTEEEFKAIKGTPEAIV